MMESGFIDATAVSVPLVGASGESPGNGTTFLQIRETVATSCIDCVQAVLYAYLNNELVAALDFTRMDGSVCVNVVFVRPKFRRRGIGSTLFRHMAAQHPGAIITCAERNCDPKVSIQPSHLPP